MTVPSPSLPSVGDLTTKHWLAVLIDEQVHHGAEIALLRDLYRARSRVVR